jgi:uncharacterized protein (DUF3084 family)
MAGGGERIMDILDEMKEMRDETQYSMHKDIYTRAVEEIEYLRRKIEILEMDYEDSVQERADLTKEAQKADNLIEQLQDEVDQLRAISRKLYVEKAHLLADKISNEIMRENFDKMEIEVQRLKSENSKLIQKINTKPKEKKKKEVKDSGKG